MTQDDAALTEVHRPTVRIDNLTFSDGTTIELKNDDIVIIVGANNSGKSACLRGIQGILQRNANSPVITDIKVKKEGSADDLLAWLDTITIRSTNDPSNPVIQALDTGLSLSDLHTYWGNSGSCLNQLSRFFCYMLTADERLSSLKSIQNISITREPPRHPIHYVIRNDNYENHISLQFRKAFGVDFVVNRSGGTEIPLHVGQRPVAGEREDRVSYNYQRAVEKLDLLQEQGDGMRSFASVLLYTLVGQESILLIDEPEAFLHPPQARLLGRMLVSNKPTNRQLLIATHSGDVLRGILDANKPNVRVLRIQRKEAINIVKELDSNKIQELWKDPLLRYSNILDGLFHEMVIVGESDSDSRFYSAVVDALNEQKGEDARFPDLMFTHCGGKDRMPTVVRALCSVGVPVRVVADFDVLNKEQPLQGIVEALGGEWNDITKSWIPVKKAIESKKAELNTEEIKTQINQILNEIATASVPPDIRPKIEKVLKQASPWAIAKSTGKSFIPSGDVTESADRLFEKLRMIGLFVVEVGELEGFMKHVGNHGPAWVNEVITKDLANDPRLRDAREFVTKLIA